MPSFKAEEYLAQISRALGGCDAEIDHLFTGLRRVSSAGGRVFILGNGGSLAIAQHLAQDFLKLCDVKAMAITCPSIITAYSNDDGFEFCFFNPVLKLAEKGDAVLIFSCSGKSRNYIEFVSGFQPMGVKLFAIIGCDGGFLMEKTDGRVHVRSNDYQVCETAFCVIADILVKSFLELKG